MKFLCFLPHRLSAAPHDLWSASSAPEFYIKETQVSCLTEEDLAWISLPNLTRPPFPIVENGDNSSYFHLDIKIRSDTVSKGFNVCLASVHQVFQKDRWQVLMWVQAKLHPDLHGSPHSSPFSTRRVNWYFSLHPHTLPLPLSLHSWIIIQPGTFGHFAVNLSVSLPAPLCHWVYWCWQQSFFVLCLTVRWASVLPH